MVTRFIYFIVFLLTICSGTAVYADHFAAADIRADYVGHGPSDLTYKVTLVMYRACEPKNAVLTSPVPISVFSSCVPGWFPLVDTVGNGPAVIVNQLCPQFDSLNSCIKTGSPWPAYERWTYSGYVTLPVACSDWTFQFRSCCRNAGVVNLCSPTTVGVQVECRVNNVFRYNMSSPRFSTEPVPYVCVNQPANFFNGPVDLDGDSIATFNKQPQGNCTGACCDPAFSTGEISYAAGYSLSNPVGSSSGYTVNLVVGNALFTPVALGKFVIAFRCNKYDRKSGAVIGYVTRDVQVPVLPCSSPPPTIDSIPKSVAGGDLLSGNVIVCCPGQAVSFDIGANSNSSRNNIYMGIDSGDIQRSLFTVNGTGQGTPKPVAHFAWTPVAGDVGSHTLVISAVDSNCNVAEPIFFKSFTVVLIKVITGVHAAPQRYRICSYDTVLQLAASQPLAYPLRWTNINGSSSGITDPQSETPIVHLRSSMQYVVFATGLPPGCKDRDTVAVLMDTTTTILITPKSPIVFCTPGILYLSANPHGNPPYGNLSCGITLTPASSVAGFTDMQPGSSGLSSVPDIHVTPFGPYHSAHHQYLLRASDLKTSGMFSLTLDSISFYINALQSGAVFDSLKIGLLCTPKTAMDTSGMFASGVTPVYSIATPLTITQTGYVSFPFTNLFNWDTTQNLILDICYTVKGTLPGAAFVDFYNANYPAATLSFTKSKGAVCGGGQADSLIKRLYMLPAIRFSYYLAPQSTFPFTWVREYGSNLLSDSSARSPQLFVDTNTKYYVYTRGSNNCHAVDSVTIILDTPVRIKVDPVDTSICRGGTVQLRVLNAGIAYWYDSAFLFPPSVSCDSCVATIARPTSDFRYTVVAADGLGCRDTLYSTVHLLPLPVFHIVTPDTIVEYGKSIRLLVSAKDIYNYIWSPQQSLDNPYAQSPVAVITQPARYVVVGFDGSCSRSDSIVIGVNYDSKLLIPSAFTPNNDGRNDKFRIVNLTFQKVIEFRVFNRFGQQVFNATDNSGWDGIFNGIPQDIGTYFYLIRITIPNGSEQSFQGDVTLIR